MDYDVVLKIYCVKTDNGQKFTKRLGTSQKPTETLFKKRLKELNIQHKLIKPYTHRHNGKGERSHRKDIDKPTKIHHTYRKNYCSNYNRLAE